MLSPAVPIPLWWQRFSSEGVFVCGFSLGKPQVTFQLYWGMFNNSYKSLQARAASECMAYTHHWRPGHAGDCSCVSAAPALALTRPLPTPTHTQQNVVTSFTRAAGSALRVLSLVDSEPDIGGGGPPPPPGTELKGRIEFQDVRCQLSEARKPARVTPEPAQPAQPSPKCAMLPPAHR